MKKLYFLSLIIATAALFFGCKKDENEPEPKPTPITEPEPEPKPEPEPTIVYDSSNVILLIKKADTEIFSNDYFSPKNEETDSRCFNKSLTIAFNSLIESPITIKVLDNLSYTYRYELTEFTISDASGDNLAENANLFNNHLKAEITHKQLKLNTKYSVNLVVSLQQLVDEEWTPVIWQGNAVNYSYNYNFTTGNIPENAIDNRDILYQYPIDRQYNYMPKEYTQGYIMLSYGYENIFDGISNYDKKVIIKGINDNDFEKQVLSFTTKACHDVPGQVAEINYSLESVSFNPEKIYSIQLAVGLDTIYQMHFRTSKYNNLSDKIKDIDLDGKAFVDGGDPIMKNISKGFVCDDFFDVFEHQKRAKTNTLVQLRADLENTEWYNNSVYKIIYEHFTEQELPRDRPFSYPPHTAMTLYNPFSINHDHLTDNEIKTGITKGIYDDGMITYNVIFQCHEDAKLAQKIIQQKDNLGEELTDDELRILNYETAEKYTPGDYPFFILFVLPGKNIVTTKERRVFVVQ